MANTINDLYTKYTNKVERTLENDRYFQYLFEIVQAGNNTIRQNNRVLHKVVDERWLTVVEEGLTSIFNIVDKPRRFIATTEEVVPVALARKITADSVRHLSQNTQFITTNAKGDIQPTKVLNVTTEESFDLYENRFVYHLIQRLFAFVDKRTDVIFWSTGDETCNTMCMESKIDDAYEEISYKVEMTVKNRQSFAENDNDNMDLFKRIDRVRRMSRTLRASSFCDIMNGCAKVRSPIQRTNLMMKDPDYRNCYKLWQFIESYDKAGYEVNVSDTAQRPDDSYIEDIYGLIAMNYMLFRSYTHGADKSEELKTIKNKTLAPKVVRRFDKQTSDKYDVIVGEGEESSASKTDMGMTAEEAGNLTAELDRIVEIEKQFLKDEEDRKRAEELAAAEAERKRAEQEELERQRREEEERIRLEHEKAERRRLELIQNSRRSRLQEKRRSVRNVNAVKKRKRSSISQDAKGKWKSVSAVKRSSVSVRKELGSERRKSSSAAALDLLWISRSARMKKPCLQALCQSMSPLRSLQKRRKKHNSSVSRNVVNVNVLSVLKLNVKALKIKISMRYLKNIPKIHITWQNVA